MSIGLGDSKYFTYPQTSAVQAHKSPLSLTPSLTAWSDNGSPGVTQGAALRMSPLSGEMGPAPHLPLDTSVNCSLYWLQET